MLGNLENSVHQTHNCSSLPRVMLHEKSEDLNLLLDLYNL